MKIPFQKITIACVICVVLLAYYLHQKSKLMSLPQKPITTVTLFVYEPVHWNLDIEEDKSIDIKKDAIAELVKLINEGTHVGPIELACGGDLIFVFEDYSKTWCYVSFQEGCIARREPNPHFIKVDKEKLVSLLLGDIKEKEDLLESH